MSLEQIPNLNNLHPIGKNKQRPSSAPIRQRALPSLLLSQKKEPNANLSQNIENQEARPQNQKKMPIFSIDGSSQAGNQPDSQAHLGQIPRDIEDGPIYITVLTHQKMPRQLSEQQNQPDSLTHLDPAERDIQISEQIPQQIVGEECEFCAKTFAGPKMLVCFECPHTYCQDCLSYYFVSKLKEHRLPKCPSPNCLKQMRKQSLALVGLGADYLQKYEEILFRVEVQAKGDDYRMCPIEKCKRGVVKSNDDKKVGKCQKCGMVFCLSCMMLEHRGKCQGFGVELLKEKYKYKQCVKCKMVIERGSGCPHMTCTCGAQFCYFCGQKWINGHWCLRTRVGGELITDKLRNSLKCLRREQHEYDNTFTGFVSRIPYNFVFMLIMIVWIAWCLIYASIGFALVFLCSMVCGQPVLIWKMCDKHFYKLIGKVIVVLCFLLYPVMMPFTGIGACVLVLMAKGGQHFLYPAISGKLFPFNFLQ